MTDAEIYDRTLMILTAKHVESFGKYYALGSGEWFTQSVARFLVAKYRRIRRRRPWCRVPWHTGRRPSPDPISAKNRNHYHAWLRWYFATDSKTNQVVSMYDLSMWHSHAKTPIDSQSR